MTITINPSRDEYAATSGQTVFNYNFKIYANTDLNVYVTPVGQAADDSTDLTTAYTVDTGTIGDPSGGFITMTTGVTLNYLVTIVSDIPSNRTTDYQNNGDFVPDTVNNDIDRTVSIAKQTEDALSRTLVLQESTQNPAPLTLPSPVAGNILQWEDDLSGLKNVTILPSSVTVSAFAATYLDESNAADTRAVLGAASPVTDNLYSFTDSGAADAYVLTADSDNLSLTAYTSNLPLVFTALNTSLTTSPTVNVDGLGVKNIKDINGATLVAGDITGRREMNYDGTDFRVTNGLAAAQTLPTGYFSGLSTELDTVGGDLDHDIKTNVGKCRDSTDAEDLVLATSEIKQIDATWATGTNAGGLASGATLAVDTTYFFFLANIAGTVGLIWDDNTSCTNGVANNSVTTFEIIALHLTDGSSNIISYEQEEDYFQWNTPILDENNVAVSTTQLQPVVSVPLGIRTIGRFNAEISSTSTRSLRFYATFGDDLTVSGTMRSMSVSSSSIRASIESDVIVDTDAKVSWKADANIANCYLYTLGFTYKRGGS